MSADDELLNEPLGKGDESEDSFEKYTGTNGQ